MKAVDLPSWVVPHEPFRYHFYKLNYDCIALSGSEEIPSSELLYLGLIREFGEAPQTLIDFINENSENQLPRLIYEMINHYPRHNLSFSLLTYNLQPDNPFQRVSSLEDMSANLQHDGSFFNYFDIAKIPVAKRVDVTAAGLDLSTSFYILADGEDGYLHSPLDGEEYEVSIRSSSTSSVESSSPASVSKLWVFYVTSGSIAMNHMSDILQRLNCCSSFRSPSTVEEEGEEKEDKKAAQQQHLVESLKDVILSFTQNDPDALHFEIGLWKSDILQQICLSFYNLDNDRFELFLNENEWPPIIVNHVTLYEARYQHMSKEVRVCYGIQEGAEGEGGLRLQLKTSSFFGMI